ncbi:MAG: YibE/F family protein [Bacilli bacterium]|nr:YibE/F family protein [Bacilli bacterium]
MKFLQKNKKFLIIYSLLLIVGIGLIIFTYNNYSLYNKTIVKVIETKDEYITTESVTFGYNEELYKEIMKAKVLNGENKNEIVTIENEYHKGEAFDQRYAKGDELFVSINKDVVHIEGYKRDKYIVLLLVFFSLIIILVGRIKGFLSIISVVINIVLFNILVYMHAFKMANLALLSFIGAIIFSIICLTLVSGFNKKTLSAVLSSIIGVSLVTLISFIVIKITHYRGIRFEQMELLTRPYEGIFISEIILGGLGAIMDISISMSSSLNELIEKDNKISRKQLIKSGFNIGKDIMSTMINVLFFTYICTGMANLTIYFRNGITLSSLLDEYISLEMTRALTGAIGITITIPIAIYITLFIYKRRAK